MSPKEGGRKGPEPEDRIGKIRLSTYRSIGIRGRDGLTVLSSDVSKGHLFPGTVEFEALPSEKRIEAEEHRARVLFAVVNKVLDIALTGGRFDPVEFHGLYKFLTKNTSVPTNPGIEPDAKPTTPDEVKRIKEYVKKDKIRASFFTWDAVQTVYPDWLRKTWLRSGSGRIYQIIRDVVLPEYKAALAEEGIGQSHRAITERRTREIPRNEHFGHPKITRYTGERTEKPKPQQTYSIYRFQDIFKRMIINHQRLDNKGYRQWKEDKETSNRYVLDKDYQSRPSVTISTATVCVRKAQYLELGEEYGYDLNSLEHDAEFKRAMAFLSGSALHKVYQYAGNRLTEDEVRTEVKIPFLLAPSNQIKGKPDMLWRNPETGEWQIAEYKNVGSYLFDQIKREGLQDYLKDTKGIYAPLADHRLQVLMYMWILRKEHNIDVKVGNIIYLHKDPRGNIRGVKEAIVVWDAVAELEVENFVKQLETANNQLAEIQKIKQDGKFNHQKAEEMLHERTTEDPWVCQNCEAKLYCERKIVSPDMAKIKKPDLPATILEQAREEHRKREEKLIEDGQLGRTLIPVDELETTRKTIVDRTKSKYVS